MVALEAQDMQAQAQVPALAFATGLHEKTERECHDAYIKCVESLPVCEWAQLEAGAAYLYRVRDYGAGGYNGFEVVKTTPAMAKVTALMYGDTGETELLRGRWQGKTFYRLNSSVASMMGLTHEMIVAEAVMRGLPVPVAVRCEYPQFFVDVPERFAKENGHPAQEVFGVHKRDKYFDGPATPADRLAEVLKTCTFRGGPCTPEKVMGWIEKAHETIAKVNCYHLRLDDEAQERTGSDINRLVATFLMDVDFYRWLLPLVSPGGVFYIGDDATG